MTIELKLKSSNDTEDRIMDYLVENVSPALAEKINAGTKTLAGALRYCRDQAGEVKGSGVCVCVEDATVFGWVIHYFEEASLDEEEKPKAARKATVPAGVKVGKAEEKPVRRPRKTRKQEAPADAAETAQETPAVNQKAEPGSPKAADPQLSLFQEVLEGGAKA